MREPQIGDLIRDNDPRMKGRTLKIIGLSQKTVQAEDAAGRLFVYLRRRVFTDGKARRNGMNLLERTA